MNSETGTSQAVKQLCELAETLVTPDRVAQAVEIPYDPDKCSAKSAAAMLGIAIPLISATCGFPVLEIGGFTSIWMGTHYEPLTEKQRQKIIQSFAKGAGLLKPSILTSDFKREFDKSFQSHGKPEVVFPKPNAGVQGLVFEDGVLVFHGSHSRFVSGHRPEDLSTYCMPGKYNVRAASERWDQFMKEAIPNADSRRYVLASFANALAGDPLKAQKILLLIGAAGAGKSTMIEAIAGCIGHHNVMRTDNLAQITRDDSRHRMRLAHATLCISADASENIGDKDALKMIVSKEPIIARKLYAEPIEITPRASLVVASNEMGLSYVLSDPGVARRFDIVSFRSAKDIKKRDSGLIHALSTDEARAGIGASLAKSLIDHLAAHDGMLLRPQVLEDELDRLRTEGDPFMSWMKASGLSVDPDAPGHAECHQDDLMESFKTYCVHNGYNTWAMRKFKGRLRALNLEETGKHGGKHSYHFFVSDLNLARVARVISIVP